MKKIKLKMGLTSAVITAVVLACVILFNAIIGILGNKISLSVDLTRDKVYEFSDQTKDLMKNLDTEVTAYALFPEGEQGEYIDYIREYLDKYKTLSNKFKVKYVDPYEDPAFLTRYSSEGQQASIGSVIVECGEEYKIIGFDQIYTQSSVTNTVQIDMERKVTNAVMSVTGKLATANIYFTEGHGEYDAQNLKYLLSGEGYTCNNVNLSTAGIPEDANIIFSVVPTYDFTAEERDALDAFVDKGGKFVYVADASQPAPLERVDGYLEEWGLKLNHDFIVELDENSALGTGTGVPVPVAKIQEHTITQKLAEKNSILAMPNSTGISAVKTKNSSSVTKLLLTSEKAYGKKNLESATLEKEKDDISGPICMAAISEKMGDNNPAVMVIGSLSAVESAVISEGAYLNGDFILNSINYLSGNKESSSIRAKQVSAELMTMTQEQVGVWMIVLQFLIPALIIIIGIVVWLRRRYK